MILEIGSLDQLGQADMCSRPVSIRLHFVNKTNILPIELRKHICFYIHLNFPPTQYLFWGSNPGPSVNLLLYVLKD